jgi:hypothetical protein
MAFISLKGLSQSAPASGLYQIISGSYGKCCGIGGSLGYALPAQDQAFVDLKVDLETQLASMTFLGRDQQTVLTELPCPPAAPLHFNFGYGLIYSNQIFFHVDPGPPPEQKYWNYTLNNESGSLRIDGMLSVNPGSCADVPNQFSHSNVVAIRISSGPLRLDRIEQDAASFRFHFGGDAPYDYIVEYLDSLTKTNWMPLATNRAEFGPIDITITNSFTNALSRFFRVRKQPCNCP